MDQMHSQADLAHIADFNADAGTQAQLHRSPGMTRRCLGLPNHSLQPAHGIRCISCCPGNTSLLAPFGHPGGESLILNADHLREFGSAQAAALKFIQQALAPFGRRPDPSPGIALENRRLLGTDHSRHSTYAMTSLMLLTRG